MQILVLGMHRSGTSLLTSLLHNMGLYVGDEQAEEATGSAASSRYWEHPEVHALDERLLADLGSSWYDVANLDLWGLDPPARDAFGAQARRVVAELDRHGDWAVKDPRLCVLLPAWVPVLTEPICIHLYRNPLHVAESLRRRDGFPLQVGLALWELYTVAALRDSAGLPAVRIGYEDLVRRPVETLENLARGLARAADREARLPVPADRVRALIDPGLCRCDERAAEARLSPLQLRLYESLRAGEAGPVAASAAARETMASFAAVYRELEHLRGVHQELEQLRADRDRWAYTGRRLRHHATHLEQILTWMSRHAPYAWAEAATGWIRRLSGSPRPSAPSQARRVLGEIAEILDANNGASDGRGDPGGAD